jgi:hypothetical protein
MLSMNIMNQSRAYAYLFGVLDMQQEDTLCRSCNSFVSTLTTGRESLAAFELQHAGELAALPDDFARLFKGAQTGLLGLKLPAEPQGQKKLGNCKLPEGLCFLKSSLALLQKI